MLNLKYIPLQPCESDDFHKFFTEIVNKFFYPEYTKKTVEFFCESEKEFTPDRVREYAERGNILVAKDGEKFAGSLIFDDPDGGVTFTRWLAVSEKYQKTGVATKLLELYEKEATKRGSHCIMLCTEERNLDFYKKQGFQYMGLNPVGYYGVADFWFYKQIQEPLEENYLR